MSSRVLHRRGGFDLECFRMPQLMVVVMGSWSARGGRSSGTVDITPRVLRAELAHTRSIMLGPWVGVLGGRVSDSCWDSAQPRKGVALLDGGLVVYQLGCQILKSPTTRHGRAGMEVRRRAPKPWCSSILPEGALYMLTRRMGCWEEETEMASRSRQGGPKGACVAER